MVELCTNSNLFRRKIDLKFKSYIMPVLPCMKSQQKKQLLIDSVEFVGGKLHLEDVYH